MIRYLVRLIAAAVFALFATASPPAKAVVISSSAFEINLTIALIPVEPIIPGNPISPSAHLGGIAQFYTGITPTALGDPMEFENIGFGGSVTQHFIPVQPITPVDPINIAFSFDGFLSSLETLAFLNTSSITSTIPVDPIFPVGSFTGMPVEFSGPLVAFDDPVVVGTWDITLTPVPEPNALVVLLSGLAPLLGFSLRKRLGVHRA